jgi:hypothetical protein
MGLDWAKGGRQDEKGLLCLYGYFHDFYILEWYYDYIGYDYYHDEFSFYYYYYDYYYTDDCTSASGSGSGIGSGSGCGFSGIGSVDYYGYDDYYSESGSGSGLGTGSDYYFYYDDKYADWHNIHHYFERLSYAMRKVVLSSSAEEVAMAAGRGALGLARAVPLQETVALLQAGLELLQRGLAEGAMQGLVQLAERLQELAGSLAEGRPQRLARGLEARLLGAEAWQELQLEVAGLEGLVYAGLLEGARGQGWVPAECEEDLGRGPVPFVCTASHLLWQALGWLEEVEWDYEVRDACRMCVVLFASLSE